MMVVFTALTPVARPVAVFAEADTTPPTIVCAGPDGLWHADNVGIACSASDSGSGLGNPMFANFTLFTLEPDGTETDNGRTGAQTVCDLASNCSTTGVIGGNKVDRKAPTISLSTPANVTYGLGQAVTASYSCADGGSGVARCAGPVASGGLVDTLSVGTHVFTVNATDNVGHITSQSVTYTVVVLEDTTPPVVTCAAPDGLWHVGDVSLACTASDSGSGLANAADAAFSLTTNVAAGSETADAPTSSRSVCDVAGNCATAGPISGNKVDKQAPYIGVSKPANTTYVLGQAVTASYSCIDGGSGVATCAGPVANGSPVDTWSVGAHSFTVDAADNVGNTASESMGYDVTYNVCVLYDQDKAHRAGSTVPIKLQICDAAGANHSSAATVVYAFSLTKQDNIVSSDVEDSGNANPDNNFRFDADLEGYIYNLSTRGLSNGTWLLTFTVTGDPVTHTVRFGVK